MPFPTLKFHRLSLPLNSLSSQTTSHKFHIPKNLSYNLRNYQKALPSPTFLKLWLTTALPNRHRSPSLLSSAQLSSSQLVSVSSALFLRRNLFFRLNFENCAVSESGGCAGEALGLGFRFCFLRRFLFSCEE